jgi:hypothetical protein
MTSRFFHRGGQLESLRKPRDGKVVHATGIIFGYTGRFKDQVGKAITHSMVRKAWRRAILRGGLSRLQIRDLIPIRFSICNSRERAKGFSWEVSSATNGTA